MRKLWLLPLLITLGCQDPPADSGEHAHHHHHTAPHGGTLLVLGDELAHLEFVLDAATGELTCYVLDGEAVNSVRVEQKELALTLQLNGAPVTATLAAQASTLTGETVGDSSEFRGTVAELKGKTDFDGTFTITVRGTEFANVELAFPEGNEGHHGHDHDGHDH